MAMSNYLRNALLSSVLKAQAYTPPTSLVLALYTTDPGANDTGTEVTGGSYARQPIVFNAVSAGSTSNTSDITFPTATGNWGTVVSVGIRDNLNNLLFYGTLTTPRTITPSMQFICKAGSITDTLT